MICSKNYMKMSEVLKQNMFFFLVDKRCELGNTARGFVVVLQVGLIFFYVGQGPAGSPGLCGLSSFRAGVPQKGEKSEKNF